MIVQESFVGVTYLIPKEECESRRHWVPVQINLGCQQLVVMFSEPELCFCKVVEKPFSDFIDPMSYSIG